jgi:hypothetical protein
MNETPGTTGYMIAAYVITAVIIRGYAASLWLRSRRE